MQLIYAGKTTCSLPQRIVFLQGFDITNSDNHWGNEELAVDEIKEELSIAKEQKNLLIYEMFEGLLVFRYQKLIRSAAGKKYFSCMGSCKVDPQVSNYRH